MSAPTVPEPTSLEDRMAVAFEEEHAEEIAPTQEGVAEQPEQPQPSETPPEELEEEDAENLEESETEDEEEDLEAAPEDGVEDEESFEIATDNDLAAALGVEVPELHQNLKVNIGDEAVPLADLIERASQTSLPDQIQGTLAEQVQQIHQNEVVRQQQFQQNEASFLAVTNLLLQKIEEGGEFSDTALAQLKERDPEAWVVKVEERRQFREMLSGSIQAAHQHQSTRQQQASEAYQANAAQEAVKLIRAIPEWQDQEVAMREAQEISQYVQERWGFTEQEMMDMPDHRMALVFRENFLAHKANAGRAQTKKTLDSKKLKAQPSVVPTRARQPKTNTAAKRFAALRKRQRETAGDVSRRDDHEEVAGEIFESFLVD